MNMFPKSRMCRIRQSFCKLLFDFSVVERSSNICQCLKNVSKHEGTHILPRFYASQDIPILSDGLAKLHQKLDK